MLDGLKDLLSHTVGMDFDIIKISTNNEITTIDAVTEDMKLIMSGDFKTEITEFIGVFGLSRLDTLNKIVNMYNDKNDKVSVNTKIRNVNIAVLDDDGNKIFDNNNLPVLESVKANTLDTIIFSRDDPKMKNNYRVVASSMIPKQYNLKRSINYDIVVIPTINAIDMLKQQASLGICETLQFEVVETDNGKYKLIIVFGDTEREAEVDFVYDIDNIGTWTGDHGWRWSISTVLSVFQYAKNADMRISISSQGIIKTTVNTGIAEYNYLMPAVTA